MKALFLFAILFVELASSTIAAQADPYHWCSVRRGYANCSYVTIEQCQAAISGNGGFCRLNPYYDGKPVVTPEERGQRKK